MRHVQVSKPLLYGFKFYLNWTSKRAHQLTFATYHASFQFIFYFTNSDFWKKSILDLLFFCFKHLHSTFASG